MQYLRYIIYTSSNNDFVNVCNCKKFNLVKIVFQNRVLSEISRKINAKEENDKNVLSLIHVPIPFVVMNLYYMFLYSF